MINKSVVRGIGVPNYSECYIKKGQSAMIFINNKYTVIYYKVIDRARSRGLIKPHERHHVIPESFYVNSSRNGPAGWLLGNPNDKNNLVWLTSREHFICHWLLVKMTVGIARRKMVLGLTKMQSTSKTHSRYTNKITSRTYSHYRAEANAAISVSKLGKPGWAKNIPKSDVTKQKIRDSLTGTTRSKESVLKSAAAITGKKHPRYNHTIYAFQLNDNLIEYCTQNEIITKYNLNKGAVSAIIHGDRLSFKGWRMVLS